MANASTVPAGYADLGLGSVVPPWLNTGDNAWQLTSATFVGLQSVPGLVILYGSVVKKKWAVNSAFMAFYAFSAVLICWVSWAFKMAFGHKLFPLWGKAGASLGQDDLMHQATLWSTGTKDTGDVAATMAYPMATMVFFQFVFAAITLVLIAGSLLGRMNFLAWMVFVPLWLTCSYTIGAFSIWGGGFLWQWGVIDYSGGYVIHLSAGVAGITAAFWVGPRLTRDRDNFPPNNVILVLAGAGLLWMGWAGFNGGDPYAANIDASMAVLNTNIATATSLLTWTALDVIFFGKPSVIGAVQGMITGLVVITPGAGVIQGWAAIIEGLFSGSIPWYTMMILHKRSKLLQSIDDTLGVFHTHAVAGFLGGILSGFFAQPVLSNWFLAVQGEHGAVYGHRRGGLQIAKQLLGGLFIIAWNIMMTSIICLVIKLVIPLRMTEEQLLVGDDSAHGEEAYALWGDGERWDVSKHGGWSDDTNRGGQLQSIGPGIHHGANPKTVPVASTPEGSPA